VTPNESDKVLTAAEVQIAFGGLPDLRGTGYWQAVSTVKSDPEFPDRFADRIGAIDRVSIDAWARITIPTWMGTVVAMFGALFGVAPIAVSDFAPSWNGAIFIVGTGALT
jgi:hypothetical protein